MIKIRRAVAVWLAALLFVTGLAVAPAGASDPDVGIDSVEEVEEAVEDVLAEVPIIEDLVEQTAADVDDLEINENTEVVVELETDGGDTVEIPDAADEPIVLEAADGAGLEVELPGEGEDAEVLDDGSVVYEDAVADTDIVVQAQDDGGVRMLAVIDGAGAPTSFDFDVDADGTQEMMVLPDGSVMILDSDGEPVSHVPAAWAYDASGNEVPSWYSVSDGALRLHVDHSSVSDYPVVADPQFKKTWYGKVTIKLNSSETSALIHSLEVGAGISTIVAAWCASTTNIPCAAVWGIGAGIVTLGKVAIDVCSNRKGVDIHWYLGVIWCSGY